jgi:hypothetical protein
VEEPEERAALPSRDGSTRPPTALAELERGTTTVAALAFFDALPAVGPDAVVGTWRGSGLATGHPLDGALEALGWYGKRFDGKPLDGDGDAHPLLFGHGAGGVLDANPAFAPLGLVLRYADLLRRPPVARCVRVVLPLVRTRRPRARVRATEHRGVVSATMTYDAQAIDDHFRAVDDDTLLGLMGARDMPRPFFFVLRRA